MNSELIDTAKPIPQIKTRGEAFEGVAFSFCKAATILLIITACGLQRFALPLVAAATSLFYILAHINGQSDTRCILRKPLIVAVFWSVVSVASLYNLLM